MTSISKLSKIVFIVVALVLHAQLKAQCTNTYAFATLAAPTNTTPATFSTCNWAGDYNTLTGAVAGQSYTLTSTAGCISVSATPGGPTIVFGTSPVVFVPGASGTYYIHYNTNCATCGTGSTCLTTTITCTSCGGGGGGGPCASITPLTGCGTSMALTTSGTGVWNMGTCFFSTPGVESIFSIVAPTTGTYSLNITSIGFDFIDFMWINAASGCGPGAPWNCIGDFASTGNYGAMPWIAGNTYYILVDPETTAATNVTFNIGCPPGGPAIAGDCAAAIPVCTNLSFTIDPNGYGAIDELCTGCVSNPSTNPASANSGCLNSGELNSTWFQVNVAAGGTLEFSFGTAGGGNCYDWIMWPVTPTICADIVGNTAPPIRCNWNFPCDSYTGMAAVLPAGGAAGNFEPSLNVLTGQQYLICFSNWSSAATAVPLDFFGTADISCVPLPVEFAQFYGIDKGGYNELIWSTAAEVNCAYFEIERSTTGENFEKIGVQKGAGTYLSTSDYRFLDYEPTADMNYYRLKQYNTDGGYEYSPIIVISQELTTDLKLVNVSPNPTSTQLNIQLLSPTDGALILTVQNMNGVMQKVSIASCKAGGNLIPLVVQELPVGMYFVQILNESTGSKEVIRFVKN